LAAGWFVITALARDCAKDDGFSFYALSVLKCKAEIAALITLRCGFRTVVLESHLTRKKR
jgi:hypothetical protein